MLPLRGVAVGLLILLAGFKSGLAIYFTDYDTLTFTPRLWPENSTIHVFTAHLEPDDLGKITYSIIPLLNQPSFCPPLGIHPQLGQLRQIGPAITAIKSAPSQNGTRKARRKKQISECGYFISAKLEGTPGARNESSTTIMVTYTPSNATALKPLPREKMDQQCRQLDPEVICFEGAKSLTAYVMENSDPLPILNLGSLNQACGVHIFNYSIHSKVLTIQANNGNNSDGAPFTVFTKNRFDREKRAGYEFSVTCHLMSNGSRDSLDTTIPGELTILDQNDSPIVSQSNETLITFFFKLSNDNYRAGQSVTPRSQLGALIALDDDIPGVNRITLKSINDTKGLIDSNLKVVAMTFNHIKNVNIVSTVLYPKFALSKNVSTVHRWKGEYCVASNLLDTAQVIRHEPLRYVICLSWDEKKEDSPPVPLEEIATEEIGTEEIGPEEQVTYKTFDTNLKIASKPPESTCGNECIIFYSSIGLGVIFIIFFLLFAIRRGHYKERKAAQSPVIGADIELANGFGDRGENRILLPDMDYATSGLNNRPRSLGFYPANAPFNSDNFFPVESKWEIPREDLLLDHVLGEGEFGRVLKGMMRTSNGTVHVAVKMLKVDETEGRHKSVRQEFMAEFSLLKQLDHSNVIKLLGASTSNRCPPLLVMEYAEFGSLKSFLRKCRRVENINHVERSEGGYEQGVRIRNRNSAEVCDYFVTPQELLGFSWQIAKGMAYLSDMKMVHRDLAARNVLITKTKMCKISDFGLTRDIYVDDAYKKKSKDRVPVKWLAPECLTDELYTSKSDVWAYGILLWELTTMGSSPYPGIQTEHLYPLLDSGYRMQQPPNCSNEVYNVMTKCWAKNPSERPPFHELVFVFSRLLEDGIEYLKLDISSVSNPGYDIFNQDETPMASTTMSTTTTTANYATPNAYAIPVIPAQ
ncbi:uncharacterized protein LOC110856673 isoform X2 [Folsomia candida]|uniref:uncharacterized protein LOC110856673 isoform X2 n=1 Tax=Folsomia candida TaxID=158441 RepID=UPI00160527AE|nr:uncharacterized protein LOC110856673 isoform X2 [Folsomia candida]